MDSQCRQCGSTKLLNRGRVSRGRFFAGHALVPAWPGGSLYECRDCALVFKMPIQAEHVYDQLYESAAGTVYASSRLRYDQELAREVILQQCSSGNVLDVGCFDGALLHSLGERFQKFGVEPSRAAVEVCRQRNIEVLASGIKDLPNISRQFDVVCAIDVIEHGADPPSFLIMLKRLVRPSGSILISTGNAATPAWRLFGGRYWYCSFPEHISFLSPAWVSQVSRKLNLEVALLKPFRHHHSDASKLHALVGFSTRLGISTGEYVLSTFLGNYQRLGPRFVLGFPGIVKDHMLVVFKTQASNPN